MCVATNQVYHSKQAPNSFNCLIFEDFNDDTFIQNLKALL